MDEDTEAAAWHQQELEGRRFREECDEFHKEFSEFLKWLRSAAFELE